ncbi:hypothetical protein SAMN05216431_10151 [Ligilactobacillus sp. WC1T17]|uniref:Uncharacterized protein n=1 Tax=Ligilactobacillus ruminis TaxID=1623 RepID=A0ABY1A8W0_9LACO|nr:hypothetical protein SAMN05216431_10151 [Ligilactobacillus ruminis]
MSEILAVIVAAVLAFYIAQRYSLDDSLDIKSGWRK